MKTNSSCNSFLVFNIFCSFTSFDFHLPSGTPVIKQSLPCSIGPYKYSSFTSSQKKSVWKRFYKAVYSIILYYLKKPQLCCFLICDGDSTTFPGNLFYWCYKLLADWPEYFLPCFKLITVSAIPSFPYVTALKTIIAPPLIWSRLNMAV